MTIKDGRLSWADWRPIGPETEPVIDPEVLIFHTIVGGLRAAESVFKTQGYTGDESTFGIGGPWDGAELDGAVWQWQDTRRQADAQFAGNAYGNSTETSDGGDPHRPWSSRQLASGVHLSVDWFRAHPHRKPHLVNATGPLGDGGFGYHQLRPDWNLDHHVCPGPVREAQLRTIIIPKVRAILAGTTVPTAPKPAPAGTELRADGVFGHDTVAAVERVEHKHGCYHDQIDGIFGPHARAGLQLYLQHLNLYHGRIDAIIGKLTVTALQHRVHAIISGSWTGQTTRLLQQALNAGRF